LGGQRLPRTGAEAHHADARPAQPDTMPATSTPAITGTAAVRATSVAAARPAAVKAASAGATATRARVIAGAAVAVAAAIGVATAVPAWADTSPTLRQSNVLATTANDHGTGQCGVPQRPDQDVWVFMWPGGNAGDLLHLTVRFDTDGDDQGDTSRTELDAVSVGTANSLRYAVTTPAGWLLVDGTSQITGTSAQNEFTLAWVCAGQASAPPSSGPTGSQGPTGHAGPPAGAPVSGAPTPSGPSRSTPPTPGASSAPASGSAAPSQGFGAEAGSGSSGDTSNSTVARLHDTRLAAARRPLTPFVAAGLVIVAVSGTVLGLRRRRGEAWAGNARALRRRGGRSRSARHLQR
jgi:hypothetical protein